jgi:CRISPR-associated protein Cmr4
VDLPVQRERHTNWPIIPGSSVKGVLREAAPKDLRPRLFGAGDNEGTSAGALSFTDARTLAFPVRSLKGVFAWVTCPQVIQRWKRDSGLVGTQITIPEIDDPGESGALFEEGSPCAHNGNKLILEEFVFDAKFAVLDFFDALESEDRKRLVVLDDTNFTHFATHATEVTARIKLKEETKTVEEHALFYQEFLPAETLLYSLVLASPSRRRDQPATAEQNLGAFRPPEAIQIGGDETTGKGLCAIRLVKGGD